MREILFRGKPKRLKAYEWVHGQLLHHRKDISKIYSDEIDYPVGVIPETVGQYTGLTDKNGKRIFEGDVCQIKNHRLIGDLPFVIEWEDFAYNGWTWRDLDEVGAVDSFTNGAARHCEVIGNIHDNPELVKEEAHA